MLDVQVAVADFVRQFRWDLDVKAGEITRLGAIELRRGSSVHGWVVTEDGSPVNEATVYLTPRAAARKPDPNSSGRLEALGTSTAANHRGFFQFAAVEPGDYVISASRDRLAPTRATVRVLKDVATVVDDPPLTLSSPQELEVYVDPATPSEDSLWTLELIQLDTHGSSLGTLSDGTIAADGSWRLEDVPPGRFLLSLATGNGDRWFHHDFVLSSDTGPIFLTVPVIEVRGRVLLGNDPLPARLTFGGRYGSESVVLASDEDGDFSGALPRPGSWEIEVEVRDPKIRRSVQQRITEGEEVDIVLPDTRVEGQVVDASGTGVRRAMVRVRNLDQPTMSAGLRADDEGRFQSVGLPTGRTIFMAEAFERSSEPQEVLLEDGRTVSDLRLVLRRNVRLSGRVVARNGSGVPGAKITAIPVEALSMGSPIVASNAAGNFELKVSPGTRELIMSVAAPGFAFRTLRIPAEEPLIVTVEEAGGTLVLELPESLDLSRWDAPRVAIFHGGGLVGIYSLRSWAAFHGQETGSGNRQVVPWMEPGPYAACLARFTELPALLAGANPGAPCVSGELMAAGELTLTLQGLER